MTDLHEDAVARRRIREDLDTSLLVEAAAGTGKTTELVKRLVAVLKSGVKVERIAAVTFTDAAAGELKLRLRAELDRARHEEQDPIAQGHLLSSLTCLEAASIGTIHSFCTDLLRERPVEAELDPNFVAIDERGEEQLFRQTFQRFVQNELASPAPALVRALRRPAPFGSDDSPLVRLEQAARILRGAQTFDAPWQKPTLDLPQLTRELTERALQVAELAARSPDRGDPLRKALEPLCIWARALRLEEQDQPRDPDRLEAELVALKSTLKKLNWGYGPYAPGLNRNELRRSVEALHAALEGWKEVADADLAPALRDALWPSLLQHQREKQRLGKVAFDDLLLLVHGLLKRDRAVRATFQAQFDRIFVDELQDTDPIQMEILLLLAADDPEVTDGFVARPVPGKLFLVGDPKQSIYRFRHAGLGPYQRAKDHLKAQPQVAVLQLSRSFRATLPIQSVINRAFEPRLSGPGGPGYVPLLGGPEPEVQQPSVVALPVPDPWGEMGFPNGRALQRWTPSAVGAFVAWLLKDSGYTVRDPETGERTKVQPRHVAVLLRNLTNFGDDLITPYAEALEAHGVPHLLVGARSFHQREEVEALRVALRAIDRPEDELSVYATLRGPFFGLEDEQLLAYRRTVGGLRPWRAGQQPSPELLPVDRALGILDRLSQDRNRRPMVETIHRLLEETRAAVGLALRHSGANVLLNVLHLADLARGHELAGGISFRSFVERVDEEAEAEKREGPTFESAIDGVRLLTVHKAKGLEFPVVILGAPNIDLAKRNPRQHLSTQDRRFVAKLMDAAPKELLEESAAERAEEEAEGLRIAYVAATRARDLLVVPVAGTGKDWRGRTWTPGWLSPLDAALYPAQKKLRPEPAPGAPEFGRRSVVRPDITDTTFLPGHYPELGVTWWDPNLLPSPLPPRQGLKAEAYLAEKDDRHAEGAARGRALAEAWSLRRRAALEDGQRLSLVPIRPSDGLPPPNDWNGAVETVQIPGGGPRPSGKRFGTLVHLILAETPLDAGATTLVALAERHGRILLAPEVEQAAAVEVVLRALASPLWQEARAARRLEREYPIVTTTPDGLVLDGVLDLAFEADGVWTVVDWKTGLLLDQEVQAREEAQLAWYGQALSQATGAYVRALLVRLS